MEFELIEKSLIFYDEPVITVRGDLNIKTFYLTKPLRDILEIKECEIIFSISNDNIYFAIESGVSGDYKTRFTLSSEGSIVVPKKIRNRIKSGVYDVDLKPIYNNGYDWYLIKKR